MPDKLDFSKSFGSSRNIGSSNRSGLIGFIPVAWFCGSLANRKKKSTLIDFSKYTITSLLILHLIGISYLILGNLFWTWENSLIDLIFINTLVPLPSQILLCLSISLFSVLLRRFLLIK